MEELDKFDTEILREMQRDAGRTTEQLSELIGLSATAIQRRLKRLRAAGIIARDVSIVDPTKIGGWMTFIVEIEIERGGHEILDRFKRTMRQLPEVQQCFYTAGDADFILIVATRDMASYEAFTSRAFLGNPTIRKFRTTVTMDTVKRGLELAV